MLVRVSRPPARRLPRPHPARWTQVLAAAVVAALLGAAPPGADASEYAAHYARYKEAIAERDLESAVVHGRRAYLASKRDRGAKDARTGVLAYNLGAVNHELGRHRDATVYLGEAVAIYGVVHGERSERIIAPLRRLAAAHQALEEWVPAERYSVRAIDVIEATRGREDPEIGQILIELTAIANGLGAHKRLRSYGLRGLAILDRGPVEDPFQIVQLHVAVAGAEMVLGDGRQANRHTERAVEICEESFGEYSPQSLQIYAFAADVYEKIGKETAARKYRRKIRKALESEAD